MPASIAQRHTGRHRRAVAAGGNRTGPGDCHAGPAGRTAAGRRAGLGLSGRDAARAPGRPRGVLPGLVAADGLVGERLCSGLSAALFQRQASPRLALRAAQPDIPVFYSYLYRRPCTGVPARLGDRGIGGLAARDLGLHQPEGAIRRLQLPGIDPHRADLPGRGLHDPVHAFGFMGAGQLR